MKGAATMLVALSLAYLRNINAEVKVHHKSFVARDYNFVFWFESLADEHLTYALCDQTHPEAEEIKCTVISEKKPFGDDKYSCDVTVKRPHRPYGSERLPQIFVYPFGQKYAALTTMRGDKGYLNFTVLQMDSCKVSETGIYYGSSPGWFFPPVVGHSDSFDVFFGNITAASCSDRMCKATIGADGRIVNELKPSIKGFGSVEWILKPIVALDNGPSGNGYFYVLTDGYVYAHVLVKPDGTEKTLARYPKPSGMIGISTKNNRLGVSHQVNVTLEYRQYDFDGNLKHHTTIISDDKDIMYVAVYNLANGGFYAFSAGCEKKRPSGGCRDYDRFFIERVDADGTKTGPIIFQGFDTSFYHILTVSQFYENDAKEVCFSLAAMRLGKDGARSEITANCFTDADFSK